MRESDCPGLAFEKLQWIFPAAVTVHNLEEAIWLPGWVGKHSAELPWHITPLYFRIALFVLTAAAYLVTLASLQKGRESAFYRRAIWPLI